MQFNVPHIQNKREHFQQAYDRFLLICAASNLLQQQVSCRHVYIRTEPRGYRIITMNETHNSQA